MLSVVAIAVAAILMGVFLIPTMEFSMGHQSSLSRATTTGSDFSTTNSTAASKTIYITIIESDTGPMEGMNGSAFHLGSGHAWPVITVQQGETVVIHVMSVNSYEPHGFTILHYYYPGVTLLPGGNVNVTFVATEPGTFLVTCLIFCAIHPLMDYGSLIVNPT
jgi:heme/copper-type cytochrome/quinol oxidase subunit 2